MFQHWVGGVFDHVVGHYRREEMRTLVGRREGGSGVCVCVCKWQVTITINLFVI